MLYHCGTLDDQRVGRDKRRLHPTCELAIYLLTPGFSRAYHQRALGVSDTTIAKYVRLSRELAQTDPTILERVGENAASITAEDGLRMAQRRGPTHLPWWSRLAMAEFAHRLEDTSQVASLFNCSRRTVQLALKTWPVAYDPLSGERLLSRTQASPSGKWRANGQS